MSNILIQLKWYSATQNGAVGFVFYQILIYEEVKHLYTLTIISVVSGLQGLWSVSSSLC